MRTAFNTVLNKRLFIGVFLLFFACFSQADETLYQVEISAPAPMDELLKKHLQMIKWRDNPRMNPAEWQRLFSVAPQDFKNLLSTEGYFSPIITSTLDKTNGRLTAKFSVDLGAPASINKVDLKFNGDIIEPAQDQASHISKLRQEWLLTEGAIFRQDDWAAAKRKLLNSLLVERFPNATITESKAEVNLETHTVALMVAVDSGAAIQFGTLNIVGLERYKPRIVENLNPIKSGAVYSQTDLLTFQTRLQESGYFRSVEVTADTKSANADGANIAPIKVTVEENKSIKMGVGVGYSTNTGARTQLTYDDLDLLNRGWRLTSSLKIEEKAQYIGGQIQLPITRKGYRDSVNGSLTRTAIEGQTLTSSQVGMKRTWGPRKREQYVGANYLVEQQDVDGGATTTKKVGTLNYGITLRHTDNDLAPTKGYLFNAQFAAAPLETLSNGSFLHSYTKAQAYYPITSSTQLIARAELGIVNGKNGAPEAFLFRAGGDQSVRGYAFQSLGVTEGLATVGGKYLATGSVEVVQWLTAQWGGAAFVDLGNAANSFKDLQPVYGYGLGVRWRSPLGPIGADIAYGQATDKYRLHFNIGIAF